METFKEFERKAWETKAARYDQTWGTVSAQTIDELLNLAGLEKGVSFLDCGCGPGHLCHRASMSGAEVVGCDYSHEMVKLASEAYPGLRFEHQDVENLTYTSQSFDVVTLNYLLLHLENQGRALLEAARVLKPGGRLLFSLWLPPAESAGLRLMFSAVKQYADISVIPPAQDIFLFADQEYSKSFLQEQGFSKVSFHRVENYWNVADADEFFTAVQAGTRIGGTIDLQTAEVKEKIRQDIAGNIDEYRKDGRYVIPTPSVIIRAELG